MEGLERKKVEDMNVTSLWDHKEMTLECEEKIESPNVMPDSREFVALGCKKLKQVNFESDSKDVRLKSKNVMSRTKDLTQGVKITEESKVVTPESKTVDVRKYVKLGSKSVSFGTDRAIDENKKQTKECIVEKPESKDLTSEKNKVTVVKSKEVTPESKNVVTESQDVKLDDKNKNATSENKKNVMESKCVKSERKNVVSKSKYVTTEVKNLNNQSCFKSESKNRMSEIESKALKSENKDVKSENKDLGSGKLFKWSIRRDSLPLVSIRNALLKRRNLSPDNLIWRRRSTGNFAAGSAGGGREIPRSAPATPLQFEPTPTPRNIKNEKQAIKPLSGSAISVRATGPTNGTGDAKESKQPSKSRQKKFQRHFPQVGPEEKVLNYYSCALVGDLLLQGHLYITKNYFAFYSNVFGYVTKLLIPTISVLRITKEKVARIIPNAVGVCTRDERHVFGSLLSRDSTYKLMTHVWKAARAPETLPPKQDLRASEVELDASEYSPEDDSSSAGDRLDAPEPPVIRREPETLIGVAGASAILQPKLIVKPAQEPGSTHYQALLISIAVLLAISASWMCYQLYLTRHPPIQDDLSKLSGEELYSELVRFRARLHGRAANELHTFLSSNLLLLSKVRQSLEALSGVILTDMAREIPGDSVFS